MICTQESGLRESSFAIMGMLLRFSAQKSTFPPFAPDVLPVAHWRKSVAFPKATPVADRDDTLVRNRLFHKRTLHFYCVGVCSPWFKILLTGNLDKYPHLSRVMVSHCPLLLPTDLRLTFGGRIESAKAFLSDWLFALLFRPFPASHFPRSP